MFKAKHHHLLQLYCITHLHLCAVVLLLSDGTRLCEQQDASSKTDSGFWLVATFFVHMIKILVEKVAAGGLYFQLIVISLILTSNQLVV